MCFALRIAVGTFHSWSLFLNQQTTSVTATLSQNALTRKSFSDYEFKYKGTVYRGSTFGKQGTEVFEVLIDPNNHSINRIKSGMYFDMVVSILVVVGIIIFFIKRRASKKTKMTLKHAPLSN